VHQLIVLSLLPQCESGDRLQQYAFLMKLSFFGAARQVTGSMFLLELDDDYRILIDCGTDLDKKEKEKEFGLFPFEASMVNLVILTHAHIDHSGQIPNLYREGYEGQILCTEATFELAELLLQDAATLNLGYVKKINKSKKLSNKFKSLKSEPYYLSKQVEEAMDNFVPLAFNKRFKFKDGGWLTFIPAGHLLGAAHVLFEIEEDGELKKVAFSGDVGRLNYPLLQDPQPLPDVDYLVCESTYGNREHINKVSPENELERLIKEACENIPGRLIIPAFSVGRTQALLFTLNKLYLDGKVKNLKVYTDSPLARASTKVYEKYVSQLNQEAREQHRNGEPLFDFENLIYLKTTKESQELAYHAEPCIIISSSGMVQGGRVEYHVAENIENQYATILFIGYTTEGTLGARMRDKNIKELNIKGVNKEVKAKIMSTDVFSGHADLGELLHFVEVQRPERLKKLMLVHGEYDSMCNFKTVLEQRGYRDVVIPEWGQTIEL
jgi:metallo-beta-lactamase family protein